ncbi:hypothetical protein LTR17_025093 [Elasticomyces elasticus]|nr:hypothetical protein LTR17_025093 [Elasticomyces elasticus]
MDHESMFDIASACGGAMTETQADGFYTRLEHDNIRLVRILPALPGVSCTDLMCTTKAYLLDEAPEYTALSYTWGAITTDCYILLDGRHFTVRRNLHRFLSHARKAAGCCSGWLWIDALSIDQCNIEERSHQVKLMSKIYTRASQTLVWLGPPYGGSEQAMLELGRNPSSWQNKRSLCGLWNTSSGAAIRALCHRPYWNRLWVFQELTFAKQVRLMCGPSIIQWEAFKTFLLNLQIVVLNPRISSRFEYQAIRTSPAIKMVQHASNQPGSTELWDLMLGLGHLGCAEPRDKVYALLGVAENTGLDIQPDYHISLPELLNLVLKYRHDTIPPTNLAEVESQRVQLETLLGVQERTTYVMDGQNGHYPAPCDDDVAAVTFALPGSPVSLWWASFYGHIAVENLVIASGIFDIGQELITAVEEDRVTRLKMLLALKHVKTQPRVLKVRVDVQDSRDTRAVSLSLLELAVRRGHPEIAAVLIDAGHFDVDAALVDHFLSPDFLLYTAIRQNDVSMVEAILNAQDVNANETRLRESPLDVAMAISSGPAAHTEAQCQIVKLLVDSRKINIPRHALHICRSPDIGRLLLDAGAYHGSIEKYGTALQSAIEAAHPGMVRLLLNAVDTAVSSQIKDIDATTLYRAAAFPTTMSVLIDSGRIDLNARDDLGRTLLNYVADHPNSPHRSEFTEVGKLLVNSNEVDINTMDNLGWTPLWYAARAGNADLVGAIFHSDRLDLPAQGPSALNDAVEQGSVMIAKMMIDSGKLDLNALAGGQTALHNAAACGHRELVKMLLDSGKVDPGIRDHKDEIALQTATRHGHDDIAELLRDFKHDNNTTSVESTISSSP